MIIEIQFPEYGRREERAGRHCSLMNMEEISLHHW
jgi:hypothetical protein